VRHEAVIFDLDDTLYPERRYALSGFAAISHELQVRHGIPAADAFRTLSSALRAGRRQSAFQELCERFTLDQREIPRLVHLMRMHTPRLRLARAARQVLAAVRRSQPVAVLTNGLPNVQVRKIAALGIEPLVDAVIYAVEHGIGIGKPDAAPFLAVCTRLGVHPRECVFVGNDPIRDVAGARAVGMRTIRVGRFDSAEALRASIVPEPDADLVVRGIADVPAALGVLAELKKTRKGIPHAA
jgi:putative hydrolase of the HAD superfamily